MASNPDRAQAPNLPITATHIFGTLTLILMLAGLAGALIQNQIGNVKDEIRLLREINRNTDDRTAIELVRREEELKRQIEIIRAELLARRQEFLTQFQFLEFKQSADDRWRTQAEINKNAVEAYLSTKAWEAWRTERERLINSLDRRITHIENMKAPPN